MGLLITNFISFGRKLFFSFCSYCLHPPPFPACRKVCLGMALKIHLVFLYLFQGNCHLSQHCLGLALAIPEVPPELLFLQLLPVLISGERQDRGCPSLLSHTARAPAAPTAVLLSASQVCSCMLYQHFWPPRIYHPFAWQALNNNITRLCKTASLMHFFYSFFSVWFCFKSVTSLQLIWKQWVILCIIINRNFKN